MGKKDEEMSKYLNIDKMKVYDDVSQKFISVSNLKGIEEADVIEIVRCKDCEFYDCKRNAGLKNHGYCEVYKGYKKADGFCDIGERRKTE